MTSARQRPAPASGKGQVYLAVVSQPGVRRNIESVPASAVEVKARQVILTLDPPADFGETVTLSYFPNNAVAASRIQDLVGNLAEGFTGLRVRNETPEGNTIQSIALTDDAKTYKIGDTIGIALTFAEAVNVSGAPTLALEIGSASRKAALVRGSGSAVLTFEYSVVEGDEDANGIAIEANGLAVPAGASIVDTVGGEAAILRLTRFAVPDHKVDGVRPIPITDPPISAGPGVSIVWSEPLDEASVPDGAGGFTVSVPGVANPVGTAVTISGSTVDLVLNTAIALGTTGVTVNYVPTATPIRDKAGNAAQRFANPLAVTVAMDETAPKLTAATVDGATLRLVYNEPLKVTSPEVAAYMAGVSGGSPFALSDVRAGVGPGNTQVTMTLDPPAQAGQTMAVAYTSTNATVATRVQDLAGNAAAGFVNPADLDPPITLVNTTGAPTIELSQAQITEGDDPQLTVTLSTGATTYGTARTFTIAAGAESTALEGQDWTLPSASVVLPAGDNSVAVTLAIIDDARLEPAETVSFKASLDGGMETAAAILSIADDDRVVLAVQGPTEPITEGVAFELTLRLEPHPDTVAGAAVADDACIVDFPVSATLARAGDTATALPSDAVLETPHTFAATDFEDCTRQVTVSVPTKGSDGVWMTDRTLTFALSPQAGSDPRVDAGETVQATVRDDTPVPGPVVTQIDLSPVPPEATANHSGPYRKEDFLALPDAAVHGFGAQLMFTITFDIDVTVTLGVTTGGPPELVLDIFGRERRARYTGAGGSGLRTMAFAWTVEQGDYDPNGLAVTGLVVNGATIRDTQDRDTSPETFPAKHFKAHRVRGGLFTMSIEVEGPAREGDPIEIGVVRNGGTEQAVGALIEITDSGMEDLRPEDVPQDQPVEIDGVRLVGLFFEAKDNPRDVDPGVVTYRMTPPGDGVADDARTLTFELVETDIRDGDGPTSWYNVGNGKATVSVLESGTGTGGPGLSVGPADAFEEPGAVLAFEVSLDATSDRTM